MPDPAPATAPEEVTGPVGYAHLARLAVERAPPPEPPEPPQVIQPRPRPEPTPPVVQPPPGPPAWYDFDGEEAQERQKRVLVLLSAGKMRTEIVRAIQREFLVDVETAGNDYAAAAKRVRDHVDDEGSIDTIMYSAMGRLHEMSAQFYRLAMQPIPEQVVDVLGPDAEDPLAGAVYRPLRPAERNQEVAARAQAAKVAISAQQTLTSLVGRRSQRWADKPAVVAVQINNTVGLSPEDQALLEKLKMPVAPGASPG